MYTKEELEQLPITELMEIAEELGIKVSQNDQLETVVYAILDKAAENSAAGLPTPKRKRTRIAKKDTNKVYTVSGAEGENLDTKSKKKGEKKPTLDKLFAEQEALEQAEREQAAQTAQAEAAESTAEAAAEAPAEAPAAEEKPAPKKRGRKSKKELEEIAAAEAAKQAAEQQAAQAETADNVPEAAEEAKAKETAEEVPANMIAQLQEKMTANTGTAEGVWEGDPGDGTDFITVVDLPIEDQAAIPSVDIFDRPLNPQPMQDVPQPVSRQQQGGQYRGERYDFANLITGNGVLEILQDGYGFLRSSDYNYLSSPDDIYVSPQQIKKWSLKTGDVVACTVRPPHENEKYFALSDIQSINGRKPHEVRDRVSFEHLTPLFPEEKFTLCGDPATTNPSVRIVDLFSPIGKGRTVNAEVIASTFDEPADRHVKIAGIVLEKAKRMVECGHDVVIFLDSITRLARAYNTVAPASGKVLTGGVDANALQKPKRFFGAARNIEGGGSLTIIATALTDTGSKMDEVIFEEFKGTGNSELQLDRMLANKRVYPAVNLVLSSTRRDDLLQDQTTLNRMWIIRKFIAEMNPIEAMSTIRDRLVQTHSNEEFLLAMNG